MKKLIVHDYWMAALMFSLVGKRSEGRGSSVLVSVDQRFRKTMFCDWAEYHDFLAAAKAHGYDYVEFVMQGAAPTGYLSHYRFGVLENAPDC